MNCFLVSISTHKLLITKSPIPDHESQDVMGERCARTEDLIFFCAEIDRNFESLTDQVADLTGFAVEIRYPDALFIPTVDQAKSALATAVFVKDFVKSRIAL